METQAKTAERLLQMRHLRWDYFNSSLFDEQGWTMLLTLFVTDVRGQPLTEVDLVKAAGGSNLTGERWMRSLAADNLIDRSEGVVRLTRTAYESLANYLSAITEIFHD